jgi:preprotein translocase subunit SecA
MSAVQSLPPLLAYPEREWPVESALDRLGTAIAARLRAGATRRRGARLSSILLATERNGAGLRGLTDIALRRDAIAAGAALRADRDATENSLARVLAVVCEASSRVLGQRPFPPQILAAAACARGMMAEMATGEGKTLAASVAAATIALSGTPVHLLTVNRYLAERDAKFAAPLYQFLGLDLGLVTDAVPPEQRRAAYRRAITVAVNNEIAFDYMRDRLALGRARGNVRRKAALLRDDPIGEAPLLRGLYHAIIDEADSVLIDEARTPLVLSAGIDGDARGADDFDRALDIADRLLEGVDYARLESERRTALLPRGQHALAELCRGESAAPWDVAAEREHLLEQALTARHMLLRDEHYLVRDGAALIIDEFTGRVLPGRTWNDGLQELIERKEGLELSSRRETLARMTYQRFARRYRRLSGLSGTFREVAGELWTVYGVRVVRIPNHRTDQKIIAAPRGHVDENAKWRAIVARVAALHGEGAPVLIGTRTLAASVRASAALREAGLPHAVLNAAQDSTEAETIAAAGRAGAITVATNMAGRGTDIGVAEAVAEGGGLRVIVSEPHDARRIDRQLIGRCGRQGQKGAAETHVALDDALLLRHCSGLERSLARAFFVATSGRSVAWAARRAQRAGERLHAGMRRDLLRADAWIGDAIAFAGEPE